MTMSVRMTTQHQSTQEATAFWNQLETNLKPTCDRISKAFTELLEG